MSFSWVEQRCKILSQILRWHFTEDIKRRIIFFEISLLPILPIFQPWADEFDVIRMLNGETQKGPILFFLGMTSISWVFADFCRSHLEQRHTLKIPARMPNVQNVSSFSNLTAKENVLRHCHGFWVRSMSSHALVTYWHFLFGRGRKRRRDTSCGENWPKVNLEMQSLAEREEVFKNSQTF